MKKWLLRGAAAFGIATLGLGGYLGYLQLSGNFHTVIAGELYRSAQPSPQQIAEYARQYGIRTIVNLRGEAEDSRWYDDEVAAAGKLGIKHIDFAMLASRQLTAAQADELVAILRDAPKPILIHCRSGADRTGLVSVIYSQQIAGIPTHQAEKQLSIFFGHIGLPVISATYAMDETWEMLERHYGLSRKHVATASEPAPLS
ncbi:dual specificity protein phosphatase family protein [Neorhizobium sp. NCHU2750]|uniref:dual specificity protein phosphatase family protein n=1 Tax=Neorhizobium sp. NCHU2750 TaxID=1825976 RepID=UPI000E74671B